MKKPKELTPIEQEREDKIAAIYAEPGMTDDEKHAASLKVRRDYGQPVVTATIEIKIPRPSLIINP